MALRGLRPTLPAETPKLLEDLLNRCWDHAPNERPSFDEVLLALAAARSALSPDELAWLDAPDGHAMPRANQAEQGQGGQAT